MQPLGRTGSPRAKLVAAVLSLERFNAFNAFATNMFNSRARIGIIANEQNGCYSCDSRIEFGTGGYPSDSNTCGNEAKHSPDNGDKDIMAMGYILVQ